MDHPIHQVEEMHALFKGQVQGVGFRMTAYRYALTFGIKGTVKNLPNGLVEIYAQGARPVLHDFITSLEKKIGPHFIQEVKVSYSPIQIPLVDFKILY